MKKLAIYGAGDRGRQALEYYGMDNISLFIDNSPLKEGTYYCEKKIETLNAFIEKKYNLEIVIASINYTDELAKTLLQNGITKFEIFGGKKRNMLIDFFEKRNIKKYNGIAVCGICNDTKMILEELRKKMEKPIYLCDCDIMSNKIEPELDEPIFKLEQVNELVDAVIISSDKYHIAMEVRLERQLKGLQIDILSPFKMDGYYSETEFLVNRYKEKEKEFLSEQKLVETKKERIQYFDKVKAYTKEAIQFTPFMKLVEIETYNRCNGVCEFCPVNKNVDPRKECWMDEKLFEKIVNDLETNAYSGRVSLFSNNEPLLDERIFEFSRYLRKHLTKARIHMFTNGTMFTIEKFKELIPELDELIIDNYTQNLTMIKPVKEIYDFCEAHPEYKKKVSIILRKPKELLTSRGGEAPNRKVKETYQGISCAFPFQQMIIRPSGKISLCCNDPYGKYTMGDLNYQSVKEIWYGEKFIKVRNDLFRGREQVEICRFCDTFSLYL